MAAPLFQAVGPAEKANRKALTLDWPAHRQFDIAFLLIESSQGESVTLVTASGFVEAAGSPFTTAGAGTQLSVFWARATSGAMPKVVTSMPADHLYGFIATARGCAQAGDPWDAIAGGIKAAASASVAVPGVTTLGADRLVLIAVTKDLDSVSAFASGQTNAALSGITEAFDSGTTLGNGGGLSLMYGTKATAGAVGTTTITVTSSRNAYFVVTLKAPLDVTVALDGSQMASAAGAVGPFVGDASVTVQGGALQAQRGTAQVVSDVTFSVTGSAATVAGGTAAAQTGVDVALSGNVLQASAGLIDAVIDVRVTPTAGRLVSRGSSVGAVTAGTAALEGAAIAASGGQVTVTADANVALSGASVAAQASTVAIAGSRDVTVALSGAALLSARGTPVAACHVDAAVSGQALALAAADVDVQGTAAPVSVSVDLVGAELATAEGNASVFTPPSDVQRIVADVFARPPVLLEIVDGLRQAVTR